MRPFTYQKAATAADAVSAIAAGGLARVSWPAAPRFTI
jgi:hypothetical protein